MYDILKGLLPWKNKMLAWFLFELLQKGNLLKIEKQILIVKNKTKLNHLKSVENISNTYKFSRFIGFTCVRIFMGSCY